ncbi:MAG: hypothetical protein LBK67_01970 [Coriobacteriales bacterium]|nr:hypothetical protein [Coriobacteriales bacterium]
MPKIKRLDGKIKEYLGCLPNIPEEEVPAGGKENNQVLYRVGKKPVFGYTPKNHIDPSEDLKLIDYARDAKL